MENTDFDVAEAHFSDESRMQAKTGLAAAERTKDPERAAYDEWATRYHPWLLEAPKDEADALLQFTVLNAWMASARIVRPRRH